MEGSTDWTWPSPSHWSWALPAHIVCRSCFPVMYGSFPHIEYLIDEFLVDHLEPKVLQAASENGAPLHILEFVITRTTPSWEEVIKAAARGGHVHVFKWFLTERRDGRGPWGTDCEKCLNEAAAHGHLELVKWFQARRIGTCNNLVFCRAVGNGHLEVAQWLHEHTDATCHADAISCAVQHGHFEVAQWLYETFEEARTVYAMTSAARYGHLDFLQWLHERTSCDVCTSDMMDDAVSGGHLNVVKWLFENCSKGCSANAPRHAARNGDLAMLQWLSTHFSSNFDSSAMDAAASKGHLEIVKWLHEHRAEGCTTRAMDTAAAHGHVQVVQWLHTNRSEGCTIKAMSWAVEFGNLDVVQWLRDNRSEGCSDSVMYLAAREGYLDVVKWCNATGIGRSSESLVAAAWEGNLDVVCYLAADRTQQGSSWGLGTAATRGHLQLLLVLARNCYSQSSLSKWWVHHAAWNFFKKILSRLSDQSASPASPSWREVLQSVEQFHVGGFRSCVCTMMDLALQRGYSKMARQFFELRDEQEQRQYVTVAGEECQIVLMRWLIENGAPLNVATAIEVATQHRYAQNVEVAWWLSECDRVALVLEGLCENKYPKLLLWVLEHTAFKDASSRATIGAAIKQRNDGTAKWLSEELVSTEVRSWCLPAEEGSEEGRPSKRRRRD